jgi:hypothetical protein
VSKNPRAAGDIISFLAMWQSFVNMISTAGKIRELYDFNIYMNIFLLFRMSVEGSNYIVLA